MARPPASAQVQVNFRMPADLKARIEAAADANNRSTTAEIVARLQATFDAQSHDLDRIIRQPLSLTDDERNELFHGENSPVNVATMRNLVRAIVAEELAQVKKGKG